MTWGEFKKILEDKGVTDAHTIDYIDVSYPTKPEYVDVALEAGDPPSFAATGG